jgi:hypothetical protein
MTEILAVLLLTALGVMGWLVLGQLRRIADALEGKLAETPAPPPQPVQYAPTQVQAAAPWMHAQQPPWPAEQFQRPGV